MTDVLLVERADGVATVTLNRPESMNSLSVELKQALVTELDAVARDESVRAVVLTGTGRGFCVGQDLREHVASLESGDRGAAEHGRRALQPDRHLAGDDAEAGDRRRERHGRRRRARASRSPATSGSRRRSRRVPASRSPTSGSSLDSGVSWTLPRLIGSARATRAVPARRADHSRGRARDGPGQRGRRAGPACCPRRTNSRRRLAAGPTAAYAAIKRSLAHGRDQRPRPQALATEARAAERARAAPRTTATPPPPSSPSRSRSSPAADPRPRESARDGGAERASRWRRGRPPCRSPASGRRPSSGRRSASRGVLSSLAIATDSGLVAGTSASVGGRGCSAGANDHSRASRSSMFSRIARALAIVASIFARLRTMPASASSRARSASSKPATASMSKLGERGPERRAACAG